MKRTVKLSREYQNNHELFGEPSAGEFLSRETTYNPGGKIITTTSYYKEGNPEQRITNEYDSKGRPVLETVEFLMEGLSERNAFEYDDKDRVVAQKKLYEDGTFDLSTHTFDDATHTTFSEKRDADGVFESRQETVHDASGNILFLIIRNEQGEELYREEFAYNEKNKPLQHSIVDKENRRALGAVYIYDEQGFLQEIKRLNEKGNQVASEQFQTDEHGNILSMDEEDNLRGTVHLAYESQYDENNRLTLTVFYTDAGIPQRKDSFVYDEEGHVIEESHFYMNLSRGSNEHYTRRFEYEFYESVKA